MKRANRLSCIVSLSAFGALIASHAGAQTPAPYPPASSPPPYPQPAPYPAAQPAPTAQPGGKCTSHAECTGNQLCMAYRCTDPPGSAPPTYAPPPQQPAPAPGTPYMPPAPAASAPPPAGAGPAALPAAYPSAAQPAPQPAAGPVPPVAATAPVAAEPESTGQFPHLLLSFERLMGLGVWSVTEEDQGVKKTSSGTSFALLVGMSSPDAIPAFVYHTPRVALDYVTNSHISIGGSVGVFAGGSSQKGADGQSEDGPALFMYEFAPRVGYYAVLSDAVGFWPRAGITVFSMSQSNKSTDGKTTTETMSGVGVNLEPTLVLRPAWNVGITGSAIADIGVSGSRDVTGGQSTSLKASNFGLMLGAYIGF